MREITVEITSRCPFNCDYCSTNSTTDGGHLPLDIILKFIDDHPAEIINISGGEPLLHPHIGEIILHALSKTDRVCIQSNLIRWIRYNSDIMREIVVEANVLPIQGRSCYIPKSNQVRILKLIHQGRGKNLPPQNITTSKNFCGQEECEKCSHIAYLTSGGEVVRAPCEKYPMEEAS